MPKQEIAELAPNFELADFHGELISLESYRERKNVILVFNRGFM